MSQNGRPRFPGTPAIIDGSKAVAYVETRVAEACCAYPITPPTTMVTLLSRVGTAAPRELVEV